MQLKPTVDFDLDHSRQRDHSKSISKPKSLLGHSLPPTALNDEKPQPPSASTLLPLASPHLPLVLNSFTRPARPPPILNPSRLTIFTASDIPQVLGRGTFGVVYPAMLDAVCPVAVKHLRPRPIRSNTMPVSRESAHEMACRHARLARIQFRREIRRYAALRTVPGVVRFYGLVEDDMFVVERLFGGALSDTIRPQFQPSTSAKSLAPLLLSPRCVLRLSILLAHAVADVHRHGISHGDLKPGNVLLSEPASPVSGLLSDAIHVKLVDFGLSRRFQPPDDDDYNDDDDDYNFNDNDDDTDGTSESNPVTKIAQSVQLAARRYSCPISGPQELSNSDSDASDDEQPSSAQERRPKRNSSAKDQKGDGESLEESDDDQTPNQQAAAELDARGTPAYLAPEGWCGPSALRRRPVALKADVYAVGMILYELETGVVPWLSMSEWSIFVAVCNYLQRPTWPSPTERIPGLRRVIEQCWAQDYRNRPTCRELARRLERLLESLDSDDADGAPGDTTSSVPTDATGATVTARSTAVVATFSIPGDATGGRTGVIYSGVNGAYATDEDGNNDDAGEDAAVDEAKAGIEEIGAQNESDGDVAANNAQPMNEFSNNISDERPTRSNLGSNLGSNIGSNSISATSLDTHQGATSQRLMNRLEFTTPPPSITTSGRASPQTPLYDNSRRLQEHLPTSQLQQQPQPQQHPQPHPHPHLHQPQHHSQEQSSITPPTSPARTSSQPSPALHVLQASTSARDQAQHSSSSLFRKTPSGSNMPISSNNSLHDVSNGYEPDSHENTISSNNTNPQASNDIQHNLSALQHAASPSSAVAPPALHYDMHTNTFQPTSHVGRSPHSPVRKYMSEEPTSPHRIASPRRAHRDEPEMPDMQRRPSANPSAPGTVRGAKYPYKDQVLKNDCASLCEALAQHENAPKEATQVLEALCAMLDDSQSNCTVVATGGTLGRLAIILARYGSKDSRLCKSVCLIILRLAVSQNSVVEMKLRFAGVCDMVLNCMYWHPADLPVIQNGACTLNSLCRLSNALCSVFVSQKGPSAALRAISRAATTFNKDVPVASAGLDVLTATAVKHAHALLMDGILQGIFLHCDSFEHVRIDERFIDVLHTLLRQLPESRDKIVAVRGCMRILSRLVDRTRNWTNYVPLLKKTCEIVANLVTSKMRVEVTAEVLESNIVESVVESLDSVRLVEEQVDVNVAVAGLLCLRNMNGLGQDVCGSLQMFNVFDVTRELVGWAPNNRAVASHVALLLSSVLKQSKGNSTMTNMDVVFDMLGVMKEKWKHDTKILEHISEAMGCIREVSPANKAQMKKAKSRNGRTDNNSSALSGDGGDAPRGGRWKFLRKKA